MEKGDVEKYLIIVLVFVGLAAIVLVLRPSPTGYAVYLGEYENQTTCEDAGNVWYDEGCYDELPVCDVGFLELCLDDVNCTSVGNGYWYNGLCNAEEEPSCSNDLTLCLDDVNCTGAGGYWYDVNGTLTCNANVQPSCSNDLSFCNETTCQSVADSYWYNGVCNADCSGDLSTCRDESGCNSVGSYWYDDNADGTSTCNTNECDDDDDCDSGLVCTTDNVCCEPQTCSDLGKECGTGWDDSCGGTVDCDDCADDENCDDGECVSDSSSSSSSSSEETQDKSKNLELSGQDKVLVSAGSSEEAELHVVNVGKYQLNCEIANENWISSEEKIEQLNKKEEVDIKYKVSVPVGTDAGDYSKELIVKCTGAISESKIIDVTVVAGEGSITGEVISESGEEGSRAGITGLVVGEGRGRVIAYVVFLLVLVCAVVLVWRRHAQIRGLDDLLFRGKEWFNNKFHKGK